MKTNTLLSLFFCSAAYFGCKGKASTPAEMPHLSKIRPANQYFHINPAEKNILKAEKGSLFTIAPDSFVLPADYQTGDKIEIHLIEATKSLDFAALPVSLEFQRNGRDTLFESAGMFYVAASYKQQPLQLRKEKKIKVKFRTNVKGDKFFVYNYDRDKGWLKHGHNQEVLLPPNLVAQAAMSEEAKESQPTVLGDTSIRVKGRKAPAKPAAPAIAMPGRVRAELYRVYEIDQLTWWNFDYPKPNLTCLKGTITGSASEYFSVTVISKSELGAYTLSVPKNFKISFYRNTKAHVFVIDEKGNIARTPFFETSDAIGHHKLPKSKCEDVGPLKMEKVPEELEKNSDKLRDYLQKAGAP